MLGLSIHGYNECCTGYLKTYEFGHKCHIVSKVSPAVVASQLADHYSRALFRRDRSNETTSHQVGFT
jgi:hypothetical protein